MPNMWFNQTFATFTNRGNANKNCYYLCLIQANSIYCYYSIEQYYMQITITYWVYLFILYEAVIRVRWQSAVKWTRFNIINRLNSIPLTCCLVRCWSFFIVRSSRENWTQRCFLWFWHRQKDTRLISNACYYTEHNFERWQLRHKLTLHQTKSILILRYYMDMAKTAIFSPLCKRYCMKYVVLPLNTFQTTDISSDILCVYISVLMWCIFRLSDFFSRTSRMEGKETAKRKKMIWWEKQKAERDREGGREGERKSRRKRRREEERGGEKKKAR